MSSFLIFCLAVFWFANIVFSGWLAVEKNRPPMKWVLLGLFFPFLALLVLIGAPAGRIKEPGVTKKSDNPS